MKRNLLLFVALFAIASLHAQSPVDDGAISATENFDAVVPPMPASSYFTYGAGTSIDFINTVDISSTAANGAGLGVEFYYDASLSTDEEITLHTFSNVAPGDYIIQYDINADFQGFSFESVISDGTTDKPQTVGIQNGFGAFQKRYTAQISIGSISDLSFEMQMSPFVTGFTSSLVYIDNIELIKMNAHLTIPSSCTTLIQEEDYDAAVSPPPSSGFTSFTNSVALSAAADVNGTGQGVEFSYTAFYNEVPATIDLATFNNVAPGTYYIQYEFDESNTQTFVALSYYNEISDGSSDSLNYIVLDTVTGFAPQRTYPITISSTSDISLRFLAGETSNNIQGAASYYIDNVQLIEVGTGATTGTDTQVACDSYTWIDGNTYTASNNTATHVVPNAAGCDSTVTLDLTINTSTTGTDVQEACNSYTWIDGNTYTASNNSATFTLTNAAGCDSVVTLDLTIVTFVTGTDTQVACDSFTWIDGNTYTVSNSTATYTVPSAAGCDSIVTLDLTINNSTTGTDTQVACDTYVWIDGNTYTTSNNTATVVLPNAVGCDSTVTLDLTINNSTTGTDTQVACVTYTWIDGNAYTTSNNTATFVVPNAAGCDSTVTLDLTINSPTSGTDTQVACNSYTWIDGNTYTSSNNTATFTLTNAAGCDSVVTLDLTINTFVTATDTQVACDSFTWIDGVTYTSSNSSVTFTLMTASGCDSIVTLDLTINNSNTGTDTQVACDTYTWIDGNAYTSSNSTATFTLTNAAGCDSVVTLDLTILNSTTGTDTQVACDTYTWIDGNTYTSSNNSATFTLPNAAGCDSVVTLDLTINNSTTGTDVQTACEAFTWIDGITYTTDNNTAQFTLATAAGCDSVVTLNLTFSSVSNTGVTVNDPTLTANIPFVPGVSLQWLNCENFTPVLNVVSTAPSFTPALPGDYAVRIVENGCIDTSACYTITTADLSQLNNDLNSLSVYPNPSNGGTIHIEYGGTIEMVQFLDLQGRVVLQLHQKSFETIDVSDLENGEYLIRISSGDLKHTKRFVKLN